jgi:hypothetical protein
VRSILAVASLALALSGALPARALTLNPVSDGSVFCCGTVIADNALVVTSDVQGIVKFARASVPAGVVQALLTLTPWAGAANGSVQVYGYGPQAAPVVPLEIFLPATYLGALQIVDLGIGQDAALDVTSFVLGATAPYLAFRLVSDRRTSSPRSK